MAFQMVQFKAQSYAIIEGKKDANKFYIIIQGKLRTQKAAPVVGEESSVILGPGDFFGVESAMSNHSRIETVIAVSDCNLIEVGADQFGLLIQKNAPVAMKIIRSFSMKLRSFDNTIARLSFRNAVEEDPSHLLTWPSSGTSSNATTTRLTRISAICSGVPKASRSARPRCACRR